MIEDAISNPHDYVLKPNKEGGGNNIFGDKVKDLLLQNQTTPLDEPYLLMKLIKTPILKTLMLRKGKLTYTSSKTELGIFSLVIANSLTGEIYLNHVDGLLPRTKQADSNEGGVNAGFAVVDHPIVVDPVHASELQSTIEDISD